MILLKKNFLGKIEKIFGKIQKFSSEITKKFFWKNRKIFSEKSGKIF